MVVDRSLKGEGDIGWLREFGLVSFGGDISTLRPYMASLEMTSRIMEGVRNSGLLLLTWLIIFEIGGDSIGGMVNNVRGSYGESCTSVI